MLLGRRTASCLLLSLGFLTGGWFPPAQISSAADELPVSAEFVRLDSDRDDRLTEGELAQAFPTDSGKLARWWRITWDTNADGWLSAAEYSAGLPGNRISPEIDFLRRDQDQSQSLSREELLFLAEKESNVLSRNFHVFDFNSDRELSPSEFQNLQVAIQPAKRQGIPDPITDLAARRTDQVWQTMAGGQPVDAAAIAIKDWAREKLVPISESLAELAPADWDHNGDGSISREEVQKFLNIAWGVISPDETSLRWDNGEVLNWSYFRGFDRDGDGRIAKAEFLRLYRAATPQLIENAWNSLDQNSDGHVTLAEASRPGVLFRNDPLRLFLTFDVNLDGFVDTDELIEKSISWQAPLAPYLVRAFDEDGDGRLAFQEFRQTPVANPMANWHSARQDRDQDGQLSFTEFYIDPFPLLVELNRYTFEKLDVDQNGYLSTTEFPFPVSYEQLKTEALFRLWNSNNDDHITFSEIQERVAKADLAFCRKLFLNWDLNEDDILTLEEVRQKGAGASPSLSREFKLLDIDSDNQLSLPELLASAAESQYVQLTQQFRVLDFDRNEQLSLAEFGYVSGRRAMPRTLADVPDPIVELMELQQAQVLEVLTKSEGNANRRWPVSTWPANELIPVRHDWQS